MSDWPFDLPLTDPRHPFHCEHMEMALEDARDALAEDEVPVGAVVVSRDGSSVDGIVSERDIVRALANRGASILTEPVTAIYTTEVRTIAPEASLEEVERLMTERRFRHVPVVVDGSLHGIVSIGDVVKHRVHELEHENSALVEYIQSGR